MKYDERTCKFNMDTGCVELLLRDGRMLSIDCTGVEDELDVTMAQQTELDYLIYNDPLGYADLILNGDPEEYLKNVTGSHGLEIQMNAGHYCFLTGDVQHLLFGVARSILMKSLYFYNFLYGSFICSMLIFMHTDR